MGREGILPIRFYFLTLQGSPCARHRLSYALFALMQATMKLELDVCDLGKGTFHTMPVVMQQQRSVLVFLFDFFLCCCCQSPGKHVRVHIPQPPPAAITISVWCVSSLALRLGLGRPILSSVLVTRLAGRKQNPTAGN